MIPLPTGVRLATFDEEVIKDLWLKIKGFDNLFGEEDMKNPDHFLQVFLAADSVTFWVEDGGFVLLKNIKPGQKAEFHACFWDRHLSSRLALLKALMGWIFLEFDLKRLESYVAAYAGAARRFLVEKLGFTLEGTLRQAWLHQGRLIDINVLGILKSEVSL